MPRPELPGGSRWAPLSTRPDPKEERPYRECPNCGRYRFRWVYSCGRVLTPEVAYQECKECRYKEEEENNA